MTVKQTHTHASFQKENSKLKSNYGDSFKKKCLFNKSLRDERHFTNLVEKVEHSRLSTA